jgi:hypothetical protein
MRSTSERATRPVAALCLACKLPIDGTEANMHVLPTHNSYSLVWMFLGVVVAPTAVLATLFFCAHLL